MCLLTTMEISLLQTERSLSLLTHILLRASRCPALDFTRKTIAKPPSASTSCSDHIIESSPSISSNYCEGNFQLHDSDVSREITQQPYTAHVIQQK